MYFKNILKKFHFKEENYYFKYWSLKTIIFLFKIKLFKKIQHVNTGIIVIIQFYIRYLNSKFNQNARI